MWGRGKGRQEDGENGGMSRQGQTLSGRRAQAKGIKRRHCLRREDKGRAVCKIHRVLKRKVRKCGEANVMGGDEDRRSKRQQLDKAIGVVR